MSKRGHLGLEHLHPPTPVLLVHAPPRCKVLVRVPAPLEHIRWERADDSRDAREHRGDRVVLEEHVAGEQLGEDGAQRPEVDLLVVREAQDDLCQTRRVER